LNSTCEPLVTYSVKHLPLGTSFTHDGERLSRTTDKPFTSASPSAFDMSPVERPNVALLVIDSLRADAVFADYIPTPNIDSSASRGAAFLQCVATATTTTPSFASILTGCYPPRHGVRALKGYRLSESAVTMSQIFAEAGYHTYADVTGPLVPETGILRGFQSANHRPAHIRFKWRDPMVAKVKSFQPPWLFLLHLWEVHQPFRSPEDPRERWDKDGYDAGVRATDELVGPIFDALGDDSIVVTTGDHGENYAETAWGARGRIVAKRIRRLKTSRWLPYVDRKLAPLAMGHGFGLDEHVIRVPLIIAGPGIQPVMVHDPVRHVDILPTLADLCGIDAPDGVDGRSLRPLMTGGSLPEEPAFMEAAGVKRSNRQIVGVRTSQWKLVRQGQRPRVLIDVRGQYKWDGRSRPDPKEDVSREHEDVATSLDEVLESILDSEIVAESGMTSEEEKVVEGHLRDLGYL
jgi:arylsulfatase A-like enzyme